MILKTAITSVLTLTIFLNQACSQNSGGQRNDHVGGRCEGCEAIYEYGDKKLSWVDTLPDFHDEGQQIELSGTIYKLDGKTPAQGVTLYIYHTNQKGIYPAGKHAKGWEKRHGYIRGWIRTGVDGKYKFLTLRPGAYPGGTNPQHVHATVKEQGINEYWIDEYLFKDDPLLKQADRSGKEQRGGSGVLTGKKNANGILVLKRDIVLGLNIPSY